MTGPCDHRALCCARVGLSATHKSSTPVPCRAPLWQGQSGGRVLADPRARGAMAQPSLGEVDLSSDQCASRCARDSGRAQAPVATQAPARAHTTLPRLRACTRPRTGLRTLACTVRSACSHARGGKHARTHARPHVAGRSGGLLAVRASSIFSPCACLGGAGGACSRRPRRRSVAAAPRSVGAGARGSGAARAAAAAAHEGLDVCMSTGWIARESAAIWPPHWVIGRIMDPI